MAQRTFLLLSLLLTLLAGPCRAAEPEIIRIPIECEDMQGVKWDAAPGFTPAWTAGRWGRDLHQNMIFGGAWSSRMANAICDGSADASEVFQDITVPQAGKYKVWAKYECPPFFHYPFGIRIQALDAAGKPGATALDKTYGLRNASKHYSFTDKLQTGDLYWAWGMDHDAAEGYQTDLAPGRYRVTLYKAAGPAGEAVGARSVDAILITSLISELSSPSYPRFPLMDELQRANHCYIRFRNTSSEPIVISFNHWNHRANYYYTMDPALTPLVRFYDAAGKLLLDDKGQPLSQRAGQWDKPLAAGETSPWIDIGPTFPTENSSPFFVDAGLPAAPSKFVPTLTYAMDVALSPAENAIVKSFAKPATDPQLVVVLQPDMHRNEGRDWTLTLLDVYRRSTANLEKFPRMGPGPKKLRLYGTIGVGFLGPLSPKNADFPATLDYAIALGLNTLPVAVTQSETVDAAMAYYTSKGAPIIELSGSYHHTQDVELLKKNFSDPKVKSRFYYVSYGDEIGLPRININDEKVLGEFHQFLTAQGVKAADVGVASMEQVKPLASYSTKVAVQIGVLPEAQAAEEKMPQGAAGAKLRRLYWWSSQFAIHKGLEDFAAKTREMTALIGPHFKTSANLGGMHPFYWMHQSSFIESFRHRAMTLAWSEDYDYCQPEGSRLAADFLAAHLRAGAKYHDTPMMFYCMPHYPGNSGQHVLQNAVTLWGQGIKDLDFFNASPDSFATENYIHSRGGHAETGRAIRQISGMAGNIEEQLLPARTKQAKVAILLSEASDVWELQGQSQWNVAPGTSISNVSQEERKAIWYCLRNNGYLVDLLTENDVAEGRLKDYQALYVCGYNLDRKTLKPIQSWVEAGGRMLLTAGAARRDQYDDAMNEVDELSGRGPVDAKAVFYGGPLRARMELLQIKPLDQVTLQGESAVAFAALASRETLAPAAGAQVLGTYAGGQPAVIRKSAGKGVVYTTGALPGQAYLRQGLLPARPMGKGGPEWNFSQVEPVDYDQQAAAAILLPVSEGKIVPDVRGNHRSVVANVLTSKTATLVTLINLAKSIDGKIAKLELTVPGLRPAKKVYTALKQKLTVQTKDGVATLQLDELDEADVLVIEH